MKLHKSVFFFLIFTLIGSALAYKIVVKAYEGEGFDDSSFEAKIVKAR